MLVFLRIRISSMFARTHVRYSACLTGDHLIGQGGSMRRRQDYPGSPQADYPGSSETEREAASNLFHTAERASITSEAPTNTDQVGAMRQPNPASSPTSIPLWQRYKKVESEASVGTAIRERRKELGYTQEWVAAMAGMSPRLIGEIERGRGTVGFEKVLLVANGLGIDLFTHVRGR